MKKSLVGAIVGVVAVVLLLFVFRSPVENLIGKVSANYIINNPHVIEKSIINLQAQKHQQEMDKNKQIVQQHGPDLFNDKDGSPVLGNANGTAQMVVFMDPFCGYCRRFHTTLNQVVKEEPNLKVIVREIPFLSEKSEMVIRAMLAAKTQNKYKEFQEALYKTDPSVTEHEILGLAKAVNMDSQKLQQDMENPALKELIKRNIHLAQQIHVSGTPTFILNGQIVAGAVDSQKLKDLLKKKEEAPKSVIG
jgi:protein-disulfide isomerase